jgi:uncharacterized membrane protein
MGTLFLNMPILELMVVSISLVVISVLLSNGAALERYYPIAIASVAFSLLFHREFISPHLIGWDVFGEFYVSQLTNAGSRWDPSVVFGDRNLSNYNAMLSVTVLPTLYSRLTGVQPELVLKMGYLPVCLMTPVVLYCAYRRMFGNRIAFLASFYFVLLPIFSGLSSRRQMIGEFVLACLILLLVKTGMPPRQRQALVIVLGAVLVFSHYSLAYIFLFWMFFVWLVPSARKSQVGSWNLSRKRVITTVLVVLLCVITFGWYTIASISPSSTLVNLGSRVSSSFVTDFFNPEAKEGVYQSVSPGFRDPFSVEFVDSVISKIPYFFILVGAIVLFKKRSTTAFEREFNSLILATGSMVLLVIALPQVASAFVAERFYHVAVFVLAPLCILGGKVLFDRLLKTLRRMQLTRRVPRAPYLSLQLVSVLLIVIFLFKVGFVYSAVGDLRWASPSLSFLAMKNSGDDLVRARLYDSYVPEEDVFGARWLSTKLGGSTEVRADLTASGHVLRGYGLMLIPLDHTISNRTRVHDGEYIYLSYLESTGVLRERTQELEVSKFDARGYLEMDRIYENGAVGIYMSLANTTISSLP